MYNSCFFVIVQFKGTYRNYVTFNFYIYHKMFFLISSHMPENLFHVKERKSYPDTTVYGAAIFEAELSISEDV